MGLWDVGLEQASKWVRDSALQMLGPLLAMLHGPQEVRNRNRRIYLIFTQPHTAQHFSTVLYTSLCPLPKTVEHSLHCQEFSTYKNVLALLPVILTFTHVTRLSPADSCPSA